MGPRQCPDCNHYNGFWQPPHAPFCCNCGGWLGYDLDNMPGNDNCNGDAGNGNGRDGGNGNANGRNGGNGGNAKKRNGGSGGTANGREGGNGNAMEAMATDARKKAKTSQEGTR